jgi:DnaJ-class molecular chaperone
MPRGAARNPGAQRPIHDPFGVFARYARHQKRAPAEERAKPLHEPDRRAFETLGFMGYAKSDEIKKAYKSLVKIHHPDANGGDKSSEDRLRAIIAAYSHLKAKGFVGR